MGSNPTQGSSFQIKVIALNVLSCFVVCLLLSSSLLCFSNIYTHTHKHTQSATLQEGKFGSRKVEEIYREEELKHLKTLMVNLDHLSLTAPGTSPLPHRKK